MEAQPNENLRMWDNQSQGGKTGLESMGGVLMYKFIILLMSFSFTQDVCEGTCFSEQEVVNITNNIKELEFKLEKGLEIEGEFKFTNPNIY